MKKRGLRVANLLRKSLARRTPTIRRYDGVDFDAVDPLDYSFNFAGVSYTGYPGRMGVSSERIEANFLGVVQGAYKRNGVIFACERARLSVFSEARFMFRRITDGRPGELFSTPELGLLENPWPNATTGDLLTRRSEEHTSELQSRFEIVCRLLLEQKKCARVKFISSSTSVAPAIPRWCYSKV